MEIQGVGHHIGSDGGVFLGDRFVLLLGGFLRDILSGALLFSPKRPNSDGQLPPVREAVVDMIQGMGGGGGRLQYLGLGGEGGIYLGYMPAAFKGSISDSII
jgi:hypothetical protein